MKFKEFTKQNTDANIVKKTHYEVLIHGKHGYGTQTFDDQNSAMNFADELKMKMVAFTIQKIDTITTFIREFIPNRKGIKK
jgi:hypothetical protein